MATGITVILVLRAKGQKWFIDPQVDYLETRLREVVVEQAFGQIGKLLDRGEKFGQIATRVLEMVQLFAAASCPTWRAWPRRCQARWRGWAGRRSRRRTRPLGIALGRMGRGPEAQREYEEALRLDPANALALQGLRSLAESAKAKPAP